MGRQIPDHLEATVMTTPTVTETDLGHRFGVRAGARVLASLQTLAAAGAYLAAAWAGLSRSTADIAGGMPLLQTLTEPYVLAGMAVTGSLLLWAGVSGLLDHRTQADWVRGQRLTIAACAFGAAVYGLGMITVSDHQLYLESTWQNLRPLVASGAVAATTLIIIVIGGRPARSR
jgi:glutathione S-transferase